MERGNGGCLCTCTSQCGFQGYVRLIRQECRWNHGNPQLPHQCRDRKGAEYPRSGGENHGRNRLQGRTAVGCIQTGRHTAQTHGCDKTPQSGLAPQNRDRRRHPPPLPVVSPGHLHQSPDRLTCLLLITVQISRAITSDTVLIWQGVPLH